MNEQSFDSKFNDAYSEKAPNFEQTVNIAVIGKVSSGKSSLINAIFQCEKGEPISEVGSTSGVTTKVIAHKLDDHVMIVDCPGLDDVTAKNSDITNEFLKSIDIGVFVITGSADALQTTNFKTLKKTAKKTFVVLNKIDEWDELEDSAYDDVVEQWKSELGVEKIYGTCTKGYDPKFRKDAPLDLRGVDVLRDDIFDFLKKEGKDLLVAKHLRSKDEYAIGIIATALVAVSGEAFIPGSAAYITATQVAAITSLHYLYTGKVLSKASALNLLPTFVGQSAGMSLFLVAKSFLPPTGVIDLAAAIIAFTITFAMLGTVKWIFENNYSLDDNELIKERFNKYKDAGHVFKDVSANDFKSSDEIIAMAKRLLSQK